MEHLRSELLRKCKVEEYPFIISTKPVGHFQVPIAESFIRYQLSDKVISGVVSQRISLHNLSRTLQHTLNVPRVPHIMARLSQASISKSTPHPRGPECHQTYYMSPPILPHDLKPAYEHAEQRRTVRCEYISRKPPNLPAHRRKL